MIGNLGSLLKLSLGSVLSLWLVDVLVNLELAEEIFLHKRALVSWSDFAGLFLSEIPVALLAVAFSCTVARFFHRKPMEEGGADSLRYALRTGCASGDQHALGFGDWLTGLAGHPPSLEEGRGKAV